MWIEVIASSITTASLLLLIFATMQYKRRKKAKKKEAHAFNRIVASINQRLQATFPSKDCTQCSSELTHTQWRWVCYPTDFATKGGIARIEVVDSSGKQQFMDVCVAANGYIALHVPSITELAYAAPEINAESSSDDDADEWFNAVFIGDLTNLINDLNAKGTLCLHIDKDGNAHVEKNGSITTVHEFGKMPSVARWGHITDKLGDEGLYAEVQEGNSIFISWA